MKLNTEHDGIQFIEQSNLEKQELISYMSELVDKDKSYIYIGNGLKKEISLMATKVAAKKFKDSSFIYKAISTTISCCCCKMPKFNMFYETWKLKNKIPSPIEATKTAFGFLMSILEAKEMLFEKTHDILDVIYSKTPSLSEATELLFIKPKDYLSSIYNNMPSLTDIKNIVAIKMDLIETACNTLKSIEEKLQELPSILEKNTIPRTPINPFEENSLSKNLEKSSPMHILQEDIILEVSSIIGEKAINNNELEWP
jgi:hypothetical protein